MNREDQGFLINSSPACMEGAKEHSGTTQALHQHHENHLSLPDLIIPYRMAAFPFSPRGLTGDLTHVPKIHPCPGPSMPPVPQHSLARAEDRLLNFYCRGKAPCCKLSGCRCQRGTGTLTQPQDTSLGSCQMGLGCA